ncbi:MAG: hypothetical protein K0R93_2296 [Anaerosolibacter sp.]|jgi:hypothetical protein|nr:hypothetical protein [Anaerosolibacter sp.]
MHSKINFNISKTSNRKVMMERKIPDLRLQRANGAENWRQKGIEYSLLNCWGERLNE